MNTYEINPLSDSRWDDFVARHPQASAFHHRGWLEALKQTYAYEPVALTSTPANEPLSNAIVICRVSSWLTGDRLVSVPFADHCEPLLSDSNEFSHLASRLANECSRSGCKYIELRPLAALQDGGGDLRPSSSYAFHELDLAPSVPELFRRLHKDSIQRRIRRAEKAQLAYERGWSSQLLADFYRLLSITRKRHQLPPQPKIWFQNLFAGLGDKVQISVARSEGKAIAAIFTVQHGSSVIYKYGCSDEKFHNLGGMPFLFWRLIEESKAAGMAKIDFGRSDSDNPGLIAFKDKFGTTRTTLTYYRYPKPANERTSPGWDTQAAKLIFSLMPSAVLATAGRALYKHIG